MKVGQEVALMSMGVSVQAVRHKDGCAGKKTDEGGVYGGVEDTTGTMLTEVLGSKHGHD